MKTLRLFGVALFTVLMSVSFSACGGSDDEEDNGGGLQTTIEGTWYLKAEVWYAWKNGQPDMQNITSQNSYEDYDKEMVWVIKKDGDNLSLIENIRNKGTQTYTLEKKGNNEYEQGNDRIVVKSVSAKQLVIDLYDFYYGNHDDAKEYGILTFMR